MKLTGLILLSIFAVTVFCDVTFADDKHNVIVIVLDGLRPDYVTPEIMPNVFSLGQRGIVCTNHHAVFPTVTRVNASSFSTGCYPGHHGILGNTIYIPAVNKDKPLSTGNAENLIKVDAATTGKLLTAPTLGEILEDAGMKIFVSSSGSSGSSFLLNPKVKGAGIVNIEMVQPESFRAHVDKLLGPPPPEAEPSVGPNRRAIDAVLRIGLDEVKPNLTFLWITDPDHTAHSKGIGTPVMLEALKHVDAEVGRLLDGVNSRGLEKNTNLILTSDHGFSTYEAPGNLVQLLVKNGLKKSAASTDVIVSERAIYVDGHKDDTIRSIVALLQRTDWIGPVFTPAANAGDPQGRIAGTFSYDLIHWAHERSGDILTDANWSNEANEQGWKGKSHDDGVAGHGTASPYDIHNTLLAFGPDFKAASTSEIPTANVDIAPTVCHLLGIKPAASMDGRIIEEILAGGHDAKSISVTKKVVDTSTTVDGIAYHSEIHQSFVQDHGYFDYAATRRSTP